MTDACASLPIRRAEISDVSAIATCVSAAYQPYIARMGKPPGPMLQDYDEVVRHQQVFVVSKNIVSKNIGIIAVLVLIPGKRDILLDNVVVHPAWQGRGLGVRLIDFAEEHSRRLGFAHLDLYTHECMHENIALYQRHGYTETSRRIESGYHRVYMRKRL